MAAHTYRTLSLSLPECPSFSRTLYVRQHADKGGMEEGMPTLFVTNLAPGWTAEEVRQLFSQFGEVEEARVGQLPVDGKAACGSAFAHVVFEDENVLDAVLEASSVSNTIQSEDTKLKMWMNQYRATRPKAFDLQKRVDNFMAMFEKNEAEEKARLLAARDQPDEDGWITVGPRIKGKKNQAVATYASQETLKDKEKKKKKTIEDFYKFQQREAKREQLATLRRKFEEDKAKIARMRAGRKFRPY